MDYESLGNILSERIAQNFGRQIERIRELDRQILAEQTYFSPYHDILYPLKKNTTPLRSELYHDTPEEDIPDIVRTSFPIHQEQMASVWPMIWLIKFTPQAITLQRWWKEFYYSPENIGGQKAIQSLKDKIEIHDEIA